MCSSRGEPSSLASMSQSSVASEGLRGVGGGPGSEDSRKARSSRTYLDGVRSAISTRSQPVRFLYAK